MAKHLVIVESPTKARTMKRYLGSEFVIEASMGHVRDLPVKKLGVDIENDFEPTYEVSKDKKKTVTSLRKKAKSADVVYLAPDPDREGEAIAWHLKEALGLPDDKVRRVTFDEFTRSAIERAFSNPGALRMDLVNAQQARRILDRIVGYKISPLLWRRIRGAMSAGRVQSVAVRMIVDREKEIRAFEARDDAEKEYWTVKAVLSPQDHPDDVFEAELKLTDKKELKTEQDASAVVEALQKAEYAVTALEQKDQSVKAPPPFSTDLLLQRASIQLHFSTRKTMRIAQQLYEGIDLADRGTAGLITYMRTDSFSLSQQALGAARQFIGDSFGKAYVPAKANVYRSGKGAQEAHEAVRPTDVTLTPEQAEPHLTKDQHRLYDLIWRRFVACQMKPARYRNTTAEITAADRIFQARGKQLLFDGFTRVLSRRADDKEQILPELHEGDKLKLHDLEPSQHFEQPPPRYSEAGLIRELKKQGIGRPSTYSPIISTIQTRKYVRLLKRRFHPTPLGEVVTEQLVKHFPKVLDLKFTGRMEENLDRIASEGEDWLKVLQDFYGPFEKNLKQADKKMKVPERKSDYTCPDCGKGLVYKFARGDWFLGCRGYPDCKFTASVDSNGKMKKKEEPELTDFDCPECGRKMVIREGRYGKFFACSGYPECKSTMNIGEDGKPTKKRSRGGEPTDVKCPNCGSPMVKRTGKRGPFLACSAYPKCKTTMSLSGKSAPVKKKPVAQLTDIDCPECGKKMVIREGRYGKFLACSGYPKCKTTRKLDKDANPAS